jgi:hypothetical protein
MSAKSKDNKSKLSLRGFFSMGEVGRYFFRGKNSGAPTNTNIKIMHGINKLSIVVFLAAVVYMILKHFVF